MGKKEEEMEDELEAENDEITSSKPSKKVKIPFTIRLEKDLLDYLAKRGSNSSKAMIARSFLDLSRYLILQPNHYNPITAVDGTPLAMLPIDLWGSILQVLSSTKQLEIGDELGKMTNINCSLDTGIHFPPDKLLYLQGMGLFECNEDATGIFRGKKQRILAIRAKNWPLNVIHALLYRLLHNHRIPEDWMDIEPKIIEVIGEKTIPSRYRNFVLEFQKKLGGLSENFTDDVAYYKFSQLTLE